MFHPQQIKVLGNVVDKISGVSTSLPSPCGPTTMSWPMMSAILLLLLSCITIIFIHRKTRKGGRSFFPTGLLFFAGVCPSLSVLCERHGPTQNQNTNYCAVKKCPKKKTTDLAPSSLIVSPENYTCRFVQRLDRNFRNAD